MEHNPALDNLRVQRLLVLVSVLLFAIKLFAWFLTNSVAVLTDALESTVNVVTGFTGLYSLRIAAQPRDANHPYGHGKAELISASFEGMLILVAGGVIMYESILNFIQPHPIRQIDTGLLLISATALGNFLMGWYCIRIGKKNHSIALTASGKHLQSDTWTTLGIILGLGLLWVTKLAWIDSVVALLFGGLIMVEGYKILRKTISGIMDEADEEVLDHLIKTLNENKSDNWIDLHNLRTIKYGSVLHVDCHLTVPWYLHVRDAHREVDKLETLIRTNFPRSVEMFVHTDGCIPPTACAVCPIRDCPERKAAFVQRLEWTFENLTSEDRHGVTGA